MEKDHTVNICLMLVRSLNSDGNLLNKKLNEEMAEPVKETEWTLFVVS